MNPNKSSNALEKFAKCFKCCKNKQGNCLPRQIIMKRKMSQMNVYATAKKKKANDEEKKT